MRTGGLLEGIRPFLTSRIWAEIAPIFASQCIYAGSGIMNYTPVYGWFYASSSSRTPSWTGVNYFYDFLVNNRGGGPYAEVVSVGDARPEILPSCPFRTEAGFSTIPR